MSENTKNYSLRKDAPEDFYDVGVVNANLDKIDTALKSIDTEARNKDGGNADTVGGKQASDFAEAEHSHDNYLPLSGGTISDSEEHINITPWGIQGNNNSEIYNFYSVSAQKVNASEINENGKALPDKYSEKEHTHTIDQITDFTPDSIINSSDFTKYEIFTNLEELSETMYDGLFYISDSQITGISLKSGQETDMQPDKTVYWDVYTRIYFDNSGNMYVAVDKHDDETDFWLRKFLKTFSPNSSDSHTHTRSQITDFPTSLPANGGNADTVDGKHASDFAEANHTHEKSDIIDFPASLPANGGNADTISGIGIDGIQTKQTGISSYTDWNDIVEPGFHKLMERGTENSPDGGDWFFPIVFAYSSSGITQLAAAYRYDWIYMRHKKTLENGTIGWTEWRKINDGGNADTIAGKSINAIQTRDSGYCFYNQNKDWNDLTDTGYYGLMHSTSTALHNPVNGKFFYPMVFKYAADSLTQLAIPHSAGENKDFGEIYIRSKNSSNGWSGWKSVGGNGCIRTVSFTAPTGSNWYRIITNDGDICSGIFTISGGVSNYSSATVFSASQCYNGTVTGTAKLVKLSHAAFNSFITKIRLVKPSTDNYYIDIYASNSGTANLKVTFNGIGWKILDNITTANASAGFSYSEEITL